MVASQPDNFSLFHLQIALGSHKETLIPLIIAPQQNVSLMFISGNIVLSAAGV